MTAPKDTAVAAALVHGIDKSFFQTPTLEVGPRPSTDGSDSENTSDATDLRPHFQPTHYPQQTLNYLLHGDVLSVLRSLPPEFSVAVPHVRPYLLTSFGSFVRMEYGTGHETSFAVFLLCLTLIRFLAFNCGKNYIGP